MASLMMEGKFGLAEMLNRLHDPAEAYMAAWSLSLLADMRLEIFILFRLLILQHLQKQEVSDGVKRNLIRIFRHPQNYTEEEEGLLINLSFDLLANLNNTVAVRSFCMEILGNFLVKYPELEPELRALVEDVIKQPNATPGLKSRAKRTLTQLNKLKL